MSREIYTNKLLQFSYYNVLTFLELDSIIILRFNVLYSNENLVP